MKLSLPPLEAEVRAVCHDTLEGTWNDCGFGNDLRIGRHRLIAQAQGSPTPFEIVVCVVKDDESAVKWYRNLGRFGEVSANPREWLRRVLREGHAELLRVEANSEIVRGV